MQTINLMYLKAAGRELGRFAFAVDAFALRQAPGQPML
jgi:hypothetical protein